MGELILLPMMPNSVFTSGQIIKNMDYFTDSSIKIWKVIGKDHTGKVRI